MKKVGIIHREYEHFTLNKELCRVLEEHGILIIGIVPNSNYKEVIALCDGIILQGGKDYSNIDFEITKYLWESNIPTLGICLGMQTMAVLFEGELSHVRNHYKFEKYVHDIHILKDSKLYEILKKENIKVNSRHHDYVNKTNMIISAYSSDSIIEAVEDPNKKFFIGVQWHPESTKDENNKKLFDYFFSIL